MGKNGSISFYKLLSIIEITQWRISRQETIEETRRSSAYWLASLACWAALSQAAQAHFPRVDTAHCGLGPPTSIRSYENASHTWSKPQRIWKTLQLQFLEVSSPQAASVFMSS